MRLKHPLFGILVFLYLTIGGLAMGQSQSFSQFLDNYWEDYLKVFPSQAIEFGDHRYDERFENNISKSHRLQQQNFYKKYLNALEKFNYARLNEQDQLSYDVLKYLIQIRIEEYQFPTHLLPLNHYYNAISLYVQQGAGDANYQFRNEKDFENFIKRTEQFLVWVDTAIANMKTSMRDSILPPAVLIEKSIPQIQKQVVSDVQQSALYTAVLRFDESLSPALLSAYKNMILRFSKKCEELSSFLSLHYLPACKVNYYWGKGMSLNKNQWYTYLVKKNTTTSSPTTDLFAKGQEELKRIHAKVSGEPNNTKKWQQVVSLLKTDSNNYYTDKTILLQHYQILLKNMEQKLPGYFKQLPKAHCTIKEIEAYREKVKATAQYQMPAPDGSKPGVFYVNTYKLDARPKYNMMWLTLHEAIPGHHLQYSLQYENDSLPKFRRFTDFTAFAEGWGLYAEYLGLEMGAYTDSLQLLGMYFADAWRSARLVTDIGLHEQNWTREEGIDYLTQHSALTMLEAGNEIDRYLAVPAQALSYKYGCLKLLAIRQQAESVLGPRFNLKEFHYQLLKDGALPLDILEKKMQRWMKQVK